MIMVFEHTDRLRIQAELTTLNNLLRRPYRDSVTAKIIEWHGRFVKAIKPVESVEPIIREHIEILKQILVDPITGAPLEKVSYLQRGSDVVCGRRALLYYMHERPSEWEFSCWEEHKIVEGAVCWLKRHDVRLLQPPLMTATYKELKASRSLRVIETDPVRVAQRARIVLRQRQIAAAKENGRREGQLLVAEQARKDVEEALGGIAQRLRERNAAERERIAAARAGDEVHLVHLQREEAAWAGRVDDIRARNLLLDDRLGDIRAIARQEEQGVAHLEQTVERAERAVADKKDRDKGDPWGAIVKIAACAALSWGAGMMFAEPAGGGFIVGKSIPI